MQAQSKTKGQFMNRTEKDRDLYMMAGSFRPRNSEFPNSNIELLEQLIDGVAVKDALGIAWYLGRDCGARLAPVIITTRIATKAGNTPVDDLRKQVSEIVRCVFTRPGYLANSVRYFRWSNPDARSFKAMPGWYLEELKHALEGMSPYILKSQKMLRKKVKLKHLIIGLRPNPVSAAKLHNITAEEMSSLYKAIIEDSPASKLQESKSVTKCREKAERVVPIVGTWPDEWASLKQAILVRFEDSIKC